MATNSSNTLPCIALRVLRANPAKASRAGKAARLNGENFPFGFGLEWFIACVPWLVVIVRASNVVVPFAVMLAGEKLHPIVAGRFEQLKVMIPLYPNAGVTLNDNRPLWPGDTVNEAVPGWASAKVGTPDTIASPEAVLEPTKFVSPR
jgi:hypothetical protein